MLKVTDKNSRIRIRQSEVRIRIRTKNVTDWQGSDPDPLVRGADPDLDTYQNVTDWQGPDPDPLIRGEDQDPYQNVTDPDPDPLLVRGADPDP